ncbi:MAG: class IV adenylate cyclase [Chloroflexi bacterium]|nr:class IV adenylate cyclase [Chloroflexota bacterium]
MGETLTETEIKLWVDDVQPVRVRLEAAGAEMTADRVFERNIRYDDVDGSLTTAGAVLRLRYDTRARLTYKGPGEISGGVISRFEAEVEVSDFDIMNLILTHLEYRQVFAYDKYRTSYRFAGCAVTLDELPYGQFVEIEGDRDTIETCRRRLELLTARPVPHSYAGAFDLVRQNMDLPFADATFEAFSGLVLSPHIGDWLTEGGDHDAAK